MVEGRFFMKIHGVEKLLVVLALLSVAWAGCGGGGTIPTVALKLIRLDGTPLDLTSGPIPIRVAVQATFSEAMDPDDAQAATTLETPAGAAAPVAYAWDSSNTVLTMTPTRNLANGTAYHVKIGAGAVSADDATPIAAVDQTFTTMTKCDIDGDGVADVIVTAEPVSAVGKVYVFSGATLSGPTTASAGAFATISGATIAEEFGWAVACAGDVNGDGYADVLVSADLAVATEKGQAYVFSGKTFSGPKTAADALATVTGVDDNDRLGHAVAAAGDVDGDGYADVLIASPKHWTGLNSGEVYVFSGATLSGPKSRTDALATIANDGDFSSFGEALSTAGDLNADGRDEVMLGAFSPASIGKVFVHDGAALAGTRNASADAMAVLTGAAAHDNFAMSLADVGDVNGDGVGDVMIGAAYANVVGSSSGRVYLFSGKTLGGPLVTTDAFAWISSTTDNEGLGEYISGAGDVDGDGRPDVLLGGSLDKAYLFSGATLTAPVGLDAAAATISSATANDFGFDVAGAGDLNGDGRADVLVTAYQDSTNCAVGITACGSVYLFDGATLSGDKTEANAVATIAGDGQDDKFSTAIAGMWKNGLSK